MSVLAPAPRHAAPAPDSTPSQGQGGIRGAFLVSTMLVLGVALMLYPSAAQWFTAWEQQGQVEDYSDAMNQAAPEDLAAEVEHARQYNSNLSSGSGLIDPFSTDAAQQEDLAVEREDLYRDLLSGGPGDVMARLSIPSIDADLPIFHGTSEETLGRGVGHLEGTALPVGGEGAHSVLTGHRGLPSAEMFTRLDELGEGDTFSVETFGETLSYEIIRTQVVEPQETESLYPEAGRDLVTLVTCTPLGLNTHRILVTAERTTAPAEDVETYRTDPFELPFPWWAVILLGSVLLQLLYLWRTRSATATAAATRSQDASRTTGHRPAPAKGD